MAVLAANEIIERKRFLEIIVKNIENSNENDVKVQNIALVKYYIKKKYYKKYY